MISCDRLEGIRFNRKFLVVKQACRKDTLAHLAKTRGVEPPAIATKADLVALIEASQAGTAASAADNTEADEEAAS